MRCRLLIPTLLLWSLTQRAAVASQDPPIRVHQEADQIRIETDRLRAAVRKRGYVSGVAAGSLVDVASGFSEQGFGLDIVDWLMEPGSDEAYRSALPGDLPYEFNNLYHGKRPKRSIEGPQICTKARELAPTLIQGSDFVAVRQSYRYTIAAPDRRAGSTWEQTIVIPQGKRYFFSADRVTSVNAVDELFLRTDLPGHIRHRGGDTFSEVYLSYLGRIPSSAFAADFPPDARYLYRRDEQVVPKRMIRAYRLRDPRTGRPGPWLAGMTLDPKQVYEAWCHQRGYVCMIQEIGGRKVLPGEGFGAAYVIGFFDSIQEMEAVYDRYAGATGLEVTAAGWRLTRPEPAAQPDPDDLLRERLEWFQDQKFGFFVHWGPYSQWGCIESWPLVEVDRWARPDDLPAWVERGRNMEAFRRDYWKLNRTFAPRRFDPADWVRAARQAGMRYFVFTTKHHDGFAMYDTRLSDYRITHPSCPHSRSSRADVAGELFDAFRRAGFGIGAYYSKADWHHPDYWGPEAPATTRNPNYDTRRYTNRWNRFKDFVHGQVDELVSRYGPLDILWLDAGQVRPPLQDIDMDRLAAAARRRQPGLIIVDRTVGGKHENYRTPEQQVPAEPLPTVWETCMTMGDQWSYRPNDRYKSPRELLHLLIDVVAKGGNLLLNVGPDADGALPAPAVSRMRALGDWLRVNGEAIYGTRAVYPYTEGAFRFTRKRDVIYAILLAPEPGRGGRKALPARLRLQSFRPAAGAEITLLGSGKLAWTADERGTWVSIPRRLAISTSGRDAYTLRIPTGQDPPIAIADADGGAAR